MASRKSSSKGKDKSGQALVIVAAVAAGLYFLADKARKPGKRGRRKR